MAFGGNTRDLGSIGEETDKTTTLHRGLLKNYVQCLKTASQFLATPSYPTSNDVRTFMTASEDSCLKRNPRRFGEATASETLRQLSSSIAYESFWHSEMAEQFFKKCDNDSSMVSCFGLVEGDLAIAGEGDLAIAGEGELT
ncbi:hypothetical protein Tco_0177974, partial [Tanacetum coccineum]